LDTPKNIAYPLPEKIHIPIDLVSQALLCIFLTFTKSPVLSLEPVMENAFFRLILA
jgi:hypothetical protein